MGLLLTNGKKEVSLGYLGFYMVRQEVAKAYNLKIGEIYKKSCIYGLTQEDNDYLDKNTPKYLDKFLWHSDCDGHFCKRDVKGIYKELTRLTPIFNNDNLKNKYIDILDLFSQGERIDLY